jgi:hypothetical protein
MARKTRPWRHLLVLIIYFYYTSAFSILRHVYLRKNEKNPFRNDGGFPPILQQHLEAGARRRPHQRYHATVLQSSHDDYTEEPYASSKQSKRPGRIRPKRPSPTSSTTTTVDNTTDESIDTLSSTNLTTNNNTSSSSSTSFLTSAQFCDIPNLHLATQRALTETMGLMYMTDIQQQTWQAAARDGRSVVGVAPTGTGNIYDVRRNKNIVARSLSL